MPWNNQSGGGGWKGSNGGPWGQGPRNTGGPTPPDLEELLRRSQDRLKRVLPGGGRNLSPVTLVAILAVAAAIIAYNFFTFRVQPDEVGVVLRFGRYDRVAQPGLNFRLPYPVETVYTPKVTRVNRITVGQITDEQGSAARDVSEESLMLTGDENIVDITFSVFWVINDASKYLFNMEDPDGSVKAVAESAMREIVGHSNIQSLLTQGKAVTEQQVEELIQRTLDSYGAGISVSQVQLQRVDPPADVVAAFRDVQAAQADQARLQNEAQTYSNKVVPEARGEASQITNAAVGYRNRLIAEAKGQADRFNEVFESYKAAPDITRRRMYIETLEGVLSDTDKVILDSKVSGSGVVPYLPLGSPTQTPRPSAQPGMAFPGAAASGASGSLTSGSGGNQ
jgi:membrane protease subunit HflK